MFKYPFGTVQELNLDWFLEQWQNFKAEAQTAFEGIDGALDGEIAKVEAAMADLYAARDAAIAARDAAAESRTAASGSAVSAANSAASSAGSATSSANSAQSAAASAQNSAESAQTSLSAKNAAQSAQTSAQTAATNALGYSNTALSRANLAEAWAVGQIGGVDVPPTADQYENNAKYYAESITADAYAAAQSATDAAQSATDAAQSATDAAQSASSIYVPKNYIYSTRNLVSIFGSIENIHNEISNGSFNNIFIGDYIPITLNGTFLDAATNESKTINTIVLMEVAAINPYIRFGDTQLSAPHILLCSRDCLPPPLQYRSVNNTWFDQTAVNPWIGSALYATLNDSDNGIIKLVEASEMGAYVFKGPNNKGMRAYLETMAAGAALPTTGAWSDRGRLFLPEEMEVYGSKIRSPKSNAIADMLYNKWPIFAGTGRHIIKGSGDGGGRCAWWLESAYSATNFCTVNSGGYANYGNADNTDIRVPLCFLMT